MCDSYLSEALFIFVALEQNGYISYNGMDSGNLGEEFPVEKHDRKLAPSIVEIYCILIQFEDIWV